MALYPPLHIVPPLSTHSHTFIFLHGTAGNGPDFARAILNTSFPFPSEHHSQKSTTSSPTTVSEASPADSTPTTTTTLPQLFPGTKWIFPTGMRRYVKVLDKEANAWFNVHDFKDRRVGEEENVEGLRESVGFLADLVAEEVRALRGVAGSGEHEGKSEQARVVVGGFSQGAAMTSILLFSGEVEVKLGSPEGDGVGIAGWVAMSGWLPFRAQMQELLEDSLKEDEKKAAVKSYTRNLLSLSTLTEDSARGTIRLRGRKKERVLVTHGDQDQRMLLDWGAGLRDLLVGTGREVEWKAFPDGHWWSQDSLIATSQWLFRTLDSTLRKVSDV